MLHQEDARKFSAKPVQQPGSMAASGPIHSWRLMLLHTRLYCIRPCLLLFWSTQLPTIVSINGVPIVYPQICCSLSEEKGHGLKGRDTTWYLKNSPVSRLFPGLRLIDRRSLLCSRWIPWLITSAVLVVPSLFDGYVHSWCTPQIVFPTKFEHVPGCLGYHLLGCCLGYFVIPLRSSRS